MMYTMGDPGFFSGLARMAGRVIGATPLGAVAVATVGRITARPGGGGLQPRLTAAPRPGYRDEPGIRGTVHRLAPGGQSGFLKIGRRMNAGNAKAARRAIRRIKAVSHLLQSIMREMPHQKCSRPHARSHVGRR